MTTKPLLQPKPLRAKGFTIHMPRSVEGIPYTSIGFDESTGWDVFLANVRAGHTVKLLRGSTVVARFEPKGDQS